MLIKDIYKLIRECIWAARYKRAVRKAKKYAALFNMTYLVILLNGSLKVVPKRTLKELIAKRRFRKGTTIQDLEGRALFIAKPYSA